MAPFCDMVSITSIHNAAATYTSIVWQQCLGHYHSIPSNTAAIHAIIVWQTCVVHIITALPNDTVAIKRLSYGWQCIPLCSDNVRAGVSFSLSHFCEF